MFKQFPIANRRVRRKRDQTQARDRQLMFPFMRSDDGCDETDCGVTNVPHNFELEAREMEVPRVPV